eukprot:TRINITY_DN5789_c0_g1_i1.p1 TRINITY_DN5789_c0_g1~~TRINITY_DN5789_c0_g1_i1.p1  ORF type:complete len:156 (+),score=33.78 TRINITY_DN5789_c0_g1_i1:69-470(+)
MAEGEATAATTSKWTEQVMADICMEPIGTGVSMRREIGEVHGIFHRLQADGKLEVRLHAFGTIIAGKWGAVMDALREAHDLLHEKGVVRIQSNLRLATRTDKAQTIDEAVQAIEEELQKQAGWSSAAARAGGS